MKNQDIEIELEDKDFLILAKMAHEKNITFNHLCEQILTSYLLKEQDKNWPDLKYDPVSETFKNLDTGESFDLKGNPINETDEDAEDLGSLSDLSDNTDETDKDWDDFGGKDHSKRQNAGKVWSEKDLVTLISKFNDRVSISEIAKILQRSEGSVRTKMIKMQLIYWNSMTNNYCIMNSQSEPYPR